MTVGGRLPDPLPREIFVFSAAVAQGISQVPRWLSALPLGTPCPLGTPALHVLAPTCHHHPASIHGLFSLVPSAGWWFVSTSEEQGWVPATYLEAQNGTRDDSEINTSKTGEGEGLWALRMGIRLVSRVFQVPAPPGGTPQLFCLSLLNSSSGLDFAQAPSVGVHSSRPTHTLTCVCQPHVGLRTGKILLGCGLQTWTALGQRTGLGLGTTRKLSPRNSRVSLQNSTETCLYSSFPLGSCGTDPKQSCGHDSC